MADDIFNFDDEVSANEEFLTEEEKFFEEFRKEEASSSAKEEDTFYDDSSPDDLTQHLWMVSFADLMTILMIFFLSLFGYAATGASSQYEKSLTSLQKDVANKSEKSVFEKMGIKPERFVAAGYGEFKPVASNDTEEGRLQNRRIEINIVR